MTRDSIEQRGDQDVAGASKVLWGEGLFLRPQHFQRQDLYHETRLSDTTQALHPYAWGIGKIVFDIDALAAGILRLLEVRAIFPDGETYVAPHRDRLPDPVALTDFAGGSDVRCFLALAQLRENGRNFAPPSAVNGTQVRYLQHDDRAVDLFTEAVEAEVATLKSRVRVITDRDPSEGLLTLPIAHLRLGSAGSFQFDALFLPPMFTIKAGPALFLQLRRLLDVLRAKIDALYGLHREPSRHVIEFRSGDIASFWLLHTASAAYAALVHLYHHPGLHPERLFHEMLKLCGALLTFSKSYSVADLPIYQHLAPGPSFELLDRMVRDLLDTVISTRCVSIALAENKPSFHIGRIDSDKIDSRSTFYLGVSADMPAAELVSTVPTRCKVGAPDDVEKFVMSAMPGVSMTHAAQVPAAVPVKPGTYYFVLDGRGPLYERMLAARSISIYVPAGIRELKLELIALTE